ncbi:Integrator complex subunit 2 [Phlyctochytrium planicorne]|nr:Integrator complex subunit 2 [Phlyctochytrium planicorne]
MQTVGPPQVFVVYYTLLFNTIVFKHQTIRDENSIDFEYLIEYETDLMDRLPINKVLLYVEEKYNREHYQSIYPTLMSLVASQYPEFLHISSFLHWESLRDEEPMIPIKFKYDAWMQIMKQDPIIPHAIIPFKTITLLMRFEFIAALSHSELIKYFDTITMELFPAVVSADRDPEILALVSRIFYTLNMISPRELGVRTINAWRQPSDSVTRSSYVHHELVLNPLLIFRCHIRVFQRHELFEICLKILECYLIASRKYALRSFARKKAANNLNGFKESHLQALLDLQESGVIQALLDIILHWKDKQHEKLIRRACQFIHQRFINSTKYIKLVHFQGYKLELLPITVAQIPSMHVCFDFIPELLSQPDQGKQVFGLYLAAHLFEKYPVQQTHAIAKDVYLPKWHALLKTRSIKPDTVE